MNLSFYRNWAARGNTVRTPGNGSGATPSPGWRETSRWCQVLRTNEYSSNLADFTMAASGGGKRALLWAEPSENSSDLFGMFYDPAAQVWGAPKQLTHDPQTERGTSAAFVGEGELVTVYDRTLISPTNAPGTSPTDLAALVYPLGEDLALDGNLFYCDPPNPNPGGTATLHLKALNLGDQVETNVVVAFYRDAVQAASELGRVTLTNALPQGTNDVTFAWPVPATLSLTEDSATGTNLFSQTVAALAPGESVEVSFVWNVAGLPNQLNVFAVLNGGSVSNNFSAANLTAELAISQVTPPWLGDGQYLPDGSFQLTVHGDAGLSYTLQASTNLVDWVPLQSFVSTNGTMTVVDSAATNFTCWFYRAVTP